MHMKRKLELVEQAIKMITRADDVDSAVRQAAVDKVAAFLEAESKEMVTRVESQIDAHTKG